jgi:hypothetical protein
VGYNPDTAWKMDPALEIWVDVNTIPVNIRLAGVLDGQTGKNVYWVVEGLLQEGYVDFAMKVDELDPPDAAGLSTLMDIQRLVSGAGGSLRWSRWSELQQAVAKFPFVAEPMPVTTAEISPESFGRQPSGCRVPRPDAASTLRTVPAKLICPDENNDRRCRVSM